MARIFLCHASEDKAQIREVYQRLRVIDGCEPWLDEEDLLPGQDWTREIPRALHKSDFILVFFSRNSVAKRGYVQREMKLALDALQELPEGTIHTIPVRLDDCEVPESFQHYHYANLFAPNGFDHIVRAIRAEITKRSGPTQPPILQTPPRTRLSEEPDTQDTILETLLINSIAMEFVLIPAGTFVMGARDWETRLSFEKPAHRVTISQPFYLGKCPVTQAQWEAVMGTNPSRFRDHPNHPMENVSWDDVHAFLHKLTERDGGRDYRLPTEAEWEYACRASTQASRYHLDIDTIAWYEGNSNGHSQPVGQKLPNAWGLYDMLGNVWEWCHDGPRKYTADAVVDPIGPNAGRFFRRGVLRGGGWATSEWLIRAACRQRRHPSDGMSSGFRCASSGRR